MQKSEIIVLAILAFLGFLFFKYFQANGGRATAPLINAIQNPVEGGGAPNSSKQDAFGVLGLPVADYSNGPIFYVANQPWYFQTGLNGIMPMSSGSTNITGAPSATATSNGV